MYNYSPHVPIKCFLLPPAVGLLGWTRVTTTKRNDSASTRRGSRLSKATGSIRSSIRRTGEWLARVSWTSAHSLELCRMYASLSASLKQMDWPRAKWKSRWRYSGSPGRGKFQDRHVSHPGRSRCSDVCCWLYFHYLSALFSWSCVAVLDCLKLSRFILRYMGSSMLQRKDSQTSPAA